MYTRIVLFFLLSVTGLLSMAQDLTGTWIGSAGGGEYVKIVLLRCGDKYVGYTHDKDGMGFCLTNFEAFYDSAQQKLKGKSKGFIDHSFAHSQTNYNLRYSALGTEEILKGTAHAKSVAMTALSFGLGIPVTLKKISVKVDTTAYMKSMLLSLQQVGLVPSDAVITGTEQTDSARIVLRTMESPRDDTALLIKSMQSRENVLIQTITNTSKTIAIKVYDSGVEDGDSISILHNNMVVASHKLVSLKPWIFQVNITDTSVEHTITLIAHNTGSLPPNTATLEIEAGNRRYTLAASSDLKHNAVIKVRYGIEP